MWLCTTCKQEFGTIADFDIHSEKTGHNEAVEKDKIEWEKSKKKTAEMLQSYVEKGYFQYANIDGKLSIVRGPKFDEMRMDENQSLEEL